MPEAERVRDADASNSAAVEVQRGAVRWPLLEGPGRRVICREQVKRSGDVVASTAAGGRLIQ
jgi:hypothetical protein